MFRIFYFPLRTIDPDWRVIISEVCLFSHSQTRCHRRNRKGCRSCCGASFDEPWEECPECGVKMKKIKYDPVYVDEAEMLDILLEDE